MKILVVQQKMIGDVLLSGLLCRHLRENLENPEIHFLANTGTEAVLEGNPYIDAIVFFTPEYRRSKLAFLRFLLEIRKGRYDVVIDVYGKLESQLITIFSKAPMRIARRKWYSRFFYSHTVERIKNKKIRAGITIEDRLQLLSPLIETLKNPEVLPEIYLTGEEREAAATSLRKQGIDPATPMLMVGLLGSSPVKTYPLDYMSALLEQIVAKFPETTLLLNYIPKQKPVVEKLLEYLSASARKRIRSDVYTPGLRSFLANLAHCDAALSNEGGAVNMAKALGVPSYSIYSPWIRKEAWDTHKGDARHQAVHLRDFEPALFENKDKKEFRKSSLEYYTYFSPDLFAQDMLLFLSNYLR